MLHFYKSQRLFEGFTHSSIVLSEKSPEMEGRWNISRHMATL